MSKVNDSIGKYFENFISEKYSELEYKGDDLLCPDFCYPKYGKIKFFIEAKVGNIKWGPRIKDYQIDVFEKLEEPVIYILGMHDFNNANERLVQKTEKGRMNYLKRNMKFLQICFVTNSFMNLLYEKEKRISKKEKLEYCMIKDSVLNNVFMNREFRRSKSSEFGEIKISPEEYYGFSYDDYQFIENKNNLFHLRGIFDPNKDKSFIDFIKRKEEFSFLEY